MTGHYWDYPTATDSVPYSDQPPGSGTPDSSNSANFWKNGSGNGYDDGYAVTGIPFASSGQNYLTDVGAYTSALSPYGTFDQSGNLREWNEALIFTSNYFRGFRGGSWFVGSGYVELLASQRDWTNPAGATDNIGFRIATAIPEPSTLCVALASTLVLVLNRKRREPE